MAPRRFKIGQEVVCVRKTFETINDLGLGVAKYNHIYHIAGYETDRRVPGIWFVTLSEISYMAIFNEDAFEPIVSDTALTELLEESLQPQTI